MAMATAVGVADRPTRRIPTPEHSPTRSAGAGPGSSPSSSSSWPWPPPAAPTPPPGPSSSSPATAWPGRHRPDPHPGHGRSSGATSFHLRVTDHHSSTTVAAGRIISQIPGVRDHSEAGRHRLGRSSPRGPPQVPVPSLAAITGDCPAVDAALTAAHLNAGLHPRQLHHGEVGHGHLLDPHRPRHRVLHRPRHRLLGARPPRPSRRSPAPPAPGPPPPSRPSAWWPSAPRPTAPPCPTVRSSPGPRRARPSRGPPWPSASPRVPSRSPSRPLDGDTVDQATAALEAVGLVPAADGPLVGHVFDTSPAAGTSVPPGTTVTLYIK